MGESSTSVLISGAGIAGPALAYWLNRYGFNPTVVEQAPRPRTKGYAFHLHGTSGIEVLKRTGVWDKILRHRRVDRDFTFVDRSDRVLARMDSPAAAADVEPSGAQITIKRADVALVLYEHTKNDIEYLFGDPIARLEDRGSDVAVTFESGNRRQFDLVIGCDGLHSGVRRLAFGDEERFRRYLGYYVAAFTVDDYPIEYGSDVIYFAPDLIATLFGLKDRQAIAVFVIRQDRELGCELEDVGSQKKAFKAALPDRGWKIPELLGRMEGATDFFLDSVSQIRMDRWSKGRIALVGDAAYCPTLLSGFGAQLALAGAYTLAGELMRAEGDFSRAYAAYEEKLRPYVAEKQKSPTQSTRFIPQSNFGLWLGHQVIKLLNVPVISKLVFKTSYGGLVQEAFTLTDYERERGQSRGGPAYRSSAGATTIKA
jgi:2-polyprenyl-6-methoxyphenol hydroxylase-like FAD-dependent oxidoreductase